MASLAQNCSTQKPSSAWRLTLYSQIYSQLFLICMTEFRFLKFREPVQKMFGCDRPTQTQSIFNIIYLVCDYLFSKSKMSNRQEINFINTFTERTVFALIRRRRMLSSTPIRGDILHPNYRQKALKFQHRMNCSSVLL